MEAFTNKKCQPCEGIGRADSVDEVRSCLENISGWVLGKDNKSIERTFTLKNFVACVDFINRIKDVAEAENHHPDLHLTGYKNLRVVLYTHTLGGVTENDLILASKISQYV